MKESKKELGAAMKKVLLFEFERGTGGILAPGRTLPIRCLAWAALLYASVLGFLYVTVFAPQSLKLPTPAYYAVALLMPVVGFILYGLIVRLTERRRATEILFYPSSLIEISVGFVIGFLFLVGVLAFLYTMGFYRVQMGNWSGWFHSFVFDSYVSGLLEELAFRAVLLRLFARMFNPLAGLLISSALFGLAHLTHGTLFQAFEIAFNAGLTMGLLYMLTGNIWMSVGMHIGWDFTEESVLGVNSTRGLLMSTPYPVHSTILTGGSYGPDGSLFAALVGVVFVIGIFYSKRKGWLAFAASHGKH